MPLPPGALTSRRANIDMAQIFHRSTNFISRFSVFASLFLVGLALTGVLLAARAPYLTNQNVTRDQPIQFSHKHHVGRRRHRLPLLPHGRREFRDGRRSSDQDVHELPFGAV